MKYKITHTTSYSYTAAVPVGHHLVHLTPREVPNQTCSFHRLSIKPVPAVSEKRLDYFGNQVNFFSIQEAHRKLVVTSTSRVEVAVAAAQNFPKTSSWENVRETLSNDLSPQGLQARQFVLNSPAVTISEELADYARLSFTPGRAVLDAALDLTARIHTDFTYDSSATELHTSPHEVFRLRRGVCQDFAHLQIACLRALGLAARYVSGYLRTMSPSGQPRLVGADSSHAWLSLYCGDAGWIDVDPTNNVVPSSDHVTLAWGRDYSDVSPIKGVYIGGGQHSMTVEVDVVPSDN